MTDKNTTTCPVCGAAIPEDAPGGLCPTCVLEGAETVASPSDTGARNAAPASVEEIAPHFPDLEILELLGAGGMGAVYKARQPQLDRTVALKILSHDLAGDPAFVERFNREARVLARLSHPNIVGVFDFGTAGSHCYLLMEYVDGVNLRQAMRTGGFTPSEALALVQEICSALKFAHEEGILHRDIKPENVLIDSKGRVKIADFGIAKMVGQSDPNLVTLTMQGSILGSPHYMAPEQFETPGDVDQRADIYSLGVVFYEMLTGELPIGRFALPSQKAAMDARIDEIVLRTLEKEREARFQSAEEVRTSVGALAQAPPAPLQAPARQANSERPTARFSLASALLTGASLILGAGLILLWMVFALKTVSSAVPAQPSAAEAAESISSRLPGMILAALSVLLFAATALVGCILGAKALGDIRESGGRKRGLGSAAFGTLAWPVVALFVLAFLIGGLGGGFDGSNGDLWWLPIPVVLVAALVAAFLLMRGVVRWAGGIDDGQGGWRHPGFGGALIASLLTAILLPSLTAGVTAAFSKNGGDRRNSRSTLQEANVDWYRGAPELVLPLQIHDGFRAEFRLAVYDGEHNPRQYAEIGTWEPSLRRKKIKLSELETCLVKVGTSTPRDDGLDSNRGVAVVLGDSGESGNLYTEDDFAKWRFEPPDQRQLPLATAQGYSYRVAAREEMVEGKSKRTGVLRLEVQLIER